MNDKITVFLISKDMINFDIDKALLQLQNLKYKIKSKGNITDIYRLIDKDNNEILLNSKGRLTLFLPILNIDDDTIKSIIKKSRYLLYKMNSLYGYILNDYEISLMTSINTKVNVLQNKILNYNIRIIKDDEQLDLGDNIYLRKDCFSDFEENTSEY